MIDTHCHLTDTRLGSQIEFVLARAAAAGVKHILTIGTHPEDDRACLEVCRGRANVRCAVGVHPNNVGDVAEGELESCAGFRRTRVSLALGEMGLDYHYGRELRGKQIEFFEFQLKLATGSRQAGDYSLSGGAEDCLAVMKSFGDVRAVFHCFTGTVAEAKEILDRGYWLGFTGW